MSGDTSPRSPRDCGLRGIPCAGSWLHSAAQPGPPALKGGPWQALPGNLGNLPNLVALELRLNLLKSLPAALSLGSGRQ